MKISKIAFIGECMFELSGNQLSNIHCSYGGDTLNAAVYFSRLSESREVYFVSAIGEDSLSQLMLKEWKGEGINCDCVLVDNAHNCGIYSVSVDAKGERSFHYWRSESAARNMLKHPEISEVSRKLNSMDAVYVSGISLAILPNADRQRLLERLSLLVEQGCKLIVDSNYRAQLWESADIAKHSMKDLYSLATVALVGLEDETSLWGDDNVDAVNGRIRALGVETVVIKDGKHGVYVAEDGKEMSLLEATKIERVVDTTAAGDSFNAAFLARYIDGNSIGDACRFAGKVAAQVIQYPGAIVPRNLFEIPLKED